MTVKETKMHVEIYRKLNFETELKTLHEKKELLPRCQTTSDMKQHGLKLTE